MWWPKDNKVFFVSNHEKQLFHDPLNISLAYDCAASVDTRFDHHAIRWAARWSEFIPWYCRHLRPMASFPSPHRISRKKNDLAFG
jgi:hypothetical protein